MPSGITGATITTLTNGTTANASDVMASLNSLKSNGVGNDGGTITTDGSGHITTATGLLRAVVFITPFVLINNIIINSGVTNTYTVTGGTVPSGAKAAFINAYFTPTAAASFLTWTPHGTAWSQANYPILGPAPGTAANVGGCFLVVLDAGGQIDVKANGANCNGINASVMAYVY